MGRRVLDERKRQKGLMKKRQKDRSRYAKRAQSSPSLSENPAHIIRNARKLPIYECLINQGWRHAGLANILISRRQPDGKIAFGAYLVDIFCLGLKNTFCNAGLTLEQYRDLCKKVFRGDPFMECPLPLAHKIIYGGIDYAASLGFTLNRDFKWSRYILEERGKFAELPEVEFGKDGKPLFISGPNDDVGPILEQLKRRVGPGNF